LSLAGDRNDKVGGNLTVQYMQVCGPVVLEGYRRVRALYIGAYRGRHGDHAISLRSIRWTLQWNIAIRKNGNLVTGQYMNGDLDHCHHDR
jgi:hypothetical protein